MVTEEEPKSSPQDQKQHKSVAENDPNGNSLFSPRFKSVAAMAGWDEEAILVAALVVEDTPDRLSKHKKRSDLQFKTPPSNSRRKRRAQRRSPVSIPVAVLDLDEEQSAKGESEETKVESTSEEKKTEEEKKTAGDELKNEESSDVSCSKNSVLPCLDKLREELSCAICLEICYEPSTTTCGHSFCKKCLRSAADKCGKRCPKCRQLISNGRSCTVNTVLWNTIQLLFPQEVEARKAAGALYNPGEDEHKSPARGNHYNVRTRSYRPSLASISQTSTRRRGMPSQDEDAEHQIPGRGSQSRNGARPPSVLHRDGTTRRRERPLQDEDAALALRLERENLAQLLSRDGSVRRWRNMSNGDEDAVLALRLQREEFMDAFRETNDQTRTSLSSARANLRAMASRAINVRTRRHPV